MPPTGKIRVLVVDDSALMRQFISDILKSDLRIEVVGTARDGKDALAQIKTLKPDVVTMDVEMPN
ncbi:MAG: response regulator, partial [Synergistaceae bacterium]|nr:response regulator [Synergistaceae bacterium]